MRPGDGACALTCLQTKTLKCFLFWFSHEELDRFSSSFGDQLFHSISLPIGLSISLPISLPSISTMARFNEPRPTVLLTSLVVSVLLSKLLT